MKLINSLFLWSVTWTLISARCSYYDNFKLTGSQSRAVALASSLRETLLCSLKYVSDMNNHTSDDGAPIKMSTYFEFWQTILPLDVFHTFFPLLASNEDNSRVLFDWNPVWDSRISTLRSVSQKIVQYWQEL